MAGYAYPIRTIGTVTSTYGGRDGFPDLEDINSLSFYGLRIDHADGGRLTMQIVQGGSGDAIELPVVGVNRYDDYIEWVWTNRRIRLYWGDTHNDHIYMEVI
jgi:hypothetical protein